MRIQSFGVQRYRSIKSAQKLPLSDLTVLIGPNNEGKSNLLRALGLGTATLSDLGRVSLRRSAASVRYRPAQRRADRYDWERDFPIAMQETTPNGRTILDFEFSLDEDELNDFRADIGSSLNGLLPIRLLLGNEGLEFAVRKQGPGGSVLTSKAAEIARFVGTRLRVEYVAPVRTADAVARVVDNMVAEQLRLVEQSEDFEQALTTIQRLQEPVLAELSRDVKDMLTDFLPEVVAVEISIPTETRLETLRRNARIVVDDGTPTDLFLKGDGVQSLAAISLIRRATSRAQQNAEIVLCVEEPESHLHPRAVHQLRQVLQEIAETQQVVITTHSPLLTNRTDIGSNLIVESSRAHSATRIAEIRDVLGVLVSDNLRAAELVLLVEGQTDVASVGALLASESDELAAAIAEGRLTIESARGGRNLPVRLSELRAALCPCHVFFDGDQAGKGYVEAALDEGLLVESDFTLAIAPGALQSEFEDLLDPALYSEAIMTKFSVDITSGPFRSGRKRWTQRMKAAFLADGQLWGDATPGKVKDVVSDCVTASPSAALHSQRRSAFDALVRSLIARLS